jgi:hypothetical protein
MLCACGRTQLRRKRRLLFERHGAFESAWTLITASALVACAALFLGVDLVGRALPDPDSPYALWRIIVAAASAVASIYTISKTFHAPGPRG